MQQLAASRHPLSKIKVSGFRQVPGYSIVINLVPEKILIPYFYSLEFEGVKKLLASYHAKKRRQLLINCQLFL